jgi:hypothetical protein
MLQSRYARVVALMRGFGLPDACAQAGGLRNDRVRRALTGSDWKTDAAGSSCLHISSTARSRFAHVRKRSRADADYATLHAIEVGSDTAVLVSEPALLLALECVRRQHSNRSS